MLIDVVKTLTRFNGYKLYIHNLSGFDGIFLFKYLIALKAEGYQVNFLKRDDKFIKISILKKGDQAAGTKAQDKFNLEIYDSYLLLLTIQPCPKSKGACLPYGIMAGSY
jgi:hypothetical protein